MQHRQVVAEALAAGGGGSHRNILTPQRGCYRRDLVCVQGIQTARAQRSLEQRVQPGWQRREFRRHCGQQAPVRYVAGEMRVGIEAPENEIERDLLVHGTRHSLNRGGPSGG